MMVMLVNSLGLLENRMVKWANSLDLLGCKMG